MKNLVYVVEDINALRWFLASSQVQLNAENSKTVFIQVFTSQTDKAAIAHITGAILDKLPAAIIAGATTAGEIAKGELHVGTTVLSISFFEKTTAVPIAMTCIPESEIKDGKSLIKAIHALGPDVAGVLILATPKCCDLVKLFKGMCEVKFSFPLFGGSAGIYDTAESSLVFCGQDCFDHGIAVVVFLGSELHIHTQTYLGWRPLSKEMSVTDCDGMLVKKIDDERAFEMYRRYLGIQNDKDFFDNVLEFPALLKRDGDIIARVPSQVEENGAIEFLGDFEIGEKFQIGYGDPDTIINNSVDIQRDMLAFEPEAIFLYTCICRRYLMQNDVNFETRPFERIAPTAGFYTYGEIFSHDNKIQLLNSTMVVTGMREGDKGEGQYHKNAVVCKMESGPEGIDPYTDKHNRIVSKLLHFIGVVTFELEQANNELTKISGIDKLTQVYNRLKLDDVLLKEIVRSQRYKNDLSVIMIDLDFFKKVNDTYGHLTGDDVLVRVASILKANTRETDYAGRWGGEEFLAILPQTNAEQAVLVAEKLRAAIDSEDIPTIKHITCSLGVTTYHENDDRDTLLARADKALYQAKQSGRNKVSFLGKSDA